MNEVPVVDAVRARLEERRNAVRPERQFLGADGEQERPQAAIELADLDAIARRHHERGTREGETAGYRMGYDTGSQHGRERQRAHDREILSEVATTLHERMAVIPERLAAPEKGKERRTKDELREEALALLDDIRASFAVLLVALANGEFDADAS